MTRNFFEPDLNDMVSRFLMIFMGHDTRKITVATDPVDSASNTTKMASQKKTGATEFNLVLPEEPAFSTGGKKIVSEWR